MCPGDIVMFEVGTGWSDELEGKIGFVVDVRKHPRRELGWYEWDCIIDGCLETGFSYDSLDPQYLHANGIVRINETG